MQPSDIMRKTFWPFLGVSCFAAAGFAQPVSVGVLGGVPLISGYSNDESRPYVVGPSLEVRLPFGFALEADGLYRRTGASYYFLGGPANPTYVSRIRGDSWEVPILGKYYFRRRGALWHPFLGTGYAFRETWTNNDVSVLSPDNLTVTRSAGGGRDPINVGAVFAAGVRVGAGPISVLPQFRYTRWGGNYEITGPRNRVDFMIGIRF